MFAPLTALLPLLASATLGVQAVTLLGGKARLSSRDEGQEGLPYTWIHPNGDEGLCLAAQGGQLKAGDAVHISTCFGDDDQYGAVQTWSIPFFGDFAEIKLSQNESLCLSEEFRPRGEPSKLYLLSCRFATKWTVHEEQLTTISISGDSHGANCVDVTKESSPVTMTGDPYGSEKSVQIWECAEGNTNQLWTLEEIDDSVINPFP